VVFVDTKYKEAWQTLNQAIASGIVVTDEDKAEIVRLRLQVKSTFETLSVIGGQAEGQVDTSGMVILSISLAVSISTMYVAMRSSGVALSFDNDKLYLLFFHTIKQDLFYYKLSCFVVLFTKAKAS